MRMQLVAVGQVAVVQLEARVSTCGSWYEVDRPGRC